MLSDESICDDTVVLTCGFWIENTFSHLQENPKIVES